MKPALTRISRLRSFTLSCLCGLVVVICSCLTQTHSVQVKPEPEALRVAAGMNSLVNMNTASCDELERLPGIGPGLAARIIEHRERYGRFRRAEHVIMVRGLSHRRFMAMRKFVVVE